MDIKNGLLGKVPFVTVALAIAMAMGFGSQLLGGETQGGQYPELLLRAQTFYEQNAGLETSPRQRSLIPYLGVGGQKVMTPRLQKRVFGQCSRSNQAHNIALYN